MVHINSFARAAAGPTGSLLLLFQTANEQEKGKTLLCPIPSIPKAGLLDINLWDDLCPCEANVTILKYCSSLKSLTSEFPVMTQGVSSLARE